MEYFVHVYKDVGSMGVQWSRALRIGGCACTDAL